MKWSRHFDVYWNSETQVVEGEGLVSLFEDLQDRDQSKGELEQLRGQVEILQSVLAQVLEQMNPEQVAEIIGEATYHTDYTITEGS